MEQPNKWPTIPHHMIPTKKIPEMKPQLHQTSMETKLESPFLTRHSNLTKLLSTTAYCTRFLKPNKIFRGNQIVTPLESSRARTLWVRNVQNMYYSDGKQCLLNGKPVSPNSPLSSLTPILDEEGVIRVQGRLRNAILPETAKHPAILPADSHLTTLIIRHVHEQVLHGGLQLTLRTIRDEFWITRGKVAIKRELNKRYASDIDVDQTNNKWPTY